MRFRTGVVRTAVTTLALVGVVVGLTATTASAETTPAVIDDPVLCGPYVPGHGQPMITADVRLTHDVDCEDAIVFGKSATIDLAGHTLKAGYIDAGELDLNGLIDATFTSGRMIIGGAGGALHFQRVAITSGLNLDSEGSVTLDHSILTGGLNNFWGPSFKGTEASDSVILGGVLVEGSISLHHDLVTGRVTAGDGQRGPKFAVEDNLIVGSVTASGDCGCGLDIGGDISHNLVIDGTISPGVLDVGPLTIEHNVVTRSPTSGIAIIGGDLGNLPFGGPITVADNLTFANQGHGIDAEAPSGVIVDGGGNRAFLNRTQPQCIGITCRGLF
jgi:hypothetical protein